MRKGYLEILGCGPSGGIPLIGDFWGDCDPLNPLNHRLRSSAVLRMNDKTLLIDTSPDLRQQFLRAALTDVDAVLYTHAHADHTHGLNDLGVVARRHQKMMPIYGTASTIKDLQTSFAYAFKNLEASSTLYKPFLESHVIDPGPWDIVGIPLHLFLQDHVTCHSLGIRVGDLAYSTDVWRLDEQAFEALKGIKTWVVDCLQLAPHNTHAHLEKVQEWVQRVQPRMVYLTHLGPSMDYEQLCKSLPSHIRPCYDGLKIDIS